MRITGPETSKSPLSINVILAQSTLISSRPPLSCHLYPQNQTPMCLWPWSHPYHHNPRMGSSEGPSQRNSHSRGNKKAIAKTVTLADAVQKTVVLSHKVLRADVNREHGQIRKVSETRLKLRLEDLARVPPVGIIKGLLVWPIPHHNKPSACRCFYINTGTVRWYATWTLQKPTPACPMSASPKDSS